ncbi:AbrB/MazE/SpoVT family DNA-binding domain-containing protein, partial [Candidatus Woesearchaeota archaeon]|nr:AbrB/MazE/SpoVT family DNA-binding domain-containing protein [Candidatus Woesearchaeota archaeon]
MKRKIIQIAGSTHLVSLPKNWIKQMGLKKGEELDVLEQGNKVIVSTDSSTAPTKLVISPERFGKFHPNYLSAAYHAGFEDVEIQYNDEKTAEKIRERITNCIGYEIVNQGENFCRIKSISHVSTSEFDQILRKVFLLLITMGD